MSSQAIVCTPTLLLLIILLLPPCTFILFPKLKFKLKGHNSGRRSRIQHRCLTESGHSETSRERCINSSRAGSITVVPQDTLLKRRLAKLKSDVVLMVCSFVIIFYIKVPLISSGMCTTYVWNNHQKSTS